MTHTIITKSNVETKELAQKLAHSLKGGEVLALSGDLGVGKTTFTRGLAKGLGIEEKITSPTFVLLKQYKISQNLKLKTQNENLKLKIKNLNLIHIDAYRMRDEQDALNIGIADFLGRSDTITIIEWPEKIKQILPKNTIWINFKHINENKREIAISNKVLE
ncbi:MAG: hypothetical protein ACD_58C00191G0001 [uncultured bacterium]|nr:MAG: hypothetical protein ACD_58C00191G0001 [uncultured bacterium]